MLRRKVGVYLHVFTSYLDVQCHLLRNCHGFASRQQLCPFHMLMESQGLTREVSMIFFVFFFCGGVPFQSWDDEFILEDTISAGC